ncbi:hypothetical protein [Desulfopila inferna]|uniref:hypothetical protein n=1 Tax=Desulfopila inferna TaxID=468528 RepID=UPI0019666735|nr:hypothetical protein [Desulfopila inferna]MBM9603400.1 hypothetical protein [Desulfopila inferna]
MIVQLIDYLRNRLQGLTYFFFGGIGAIVVWSLTVDLHHAHTWAEKAIPAFWGLFAFISVIVIIYFARWFGRGGITIREDYYDN